MPMLVSSILRPPPPYRRPSLSADAPGPRRPPQQQCLSPRPRPGNRQPTPTLPAERRSGPKGRHEGSPLTRKPDIHALGPDCRQPSGGSDKDSQSSHPGRPRHAFRTPSPPCLASRKLTRPSRVAPVSSRRPGSATSRSRSSPAIPTDRSYTPGYSPEETSSEEIGPSPKVPPGGRSMAVPKPSSSSPTSFPPPIATDAPTATTHHPSTPSSAFGSPQSIALRRPLLPNRGRLCPYLDGLRSSPRGEPDAPSAPCDPDPPPRPEVDYHLGTTSPLPTRRVYAPDPDHSLPFRSLATSEVTGLPPSPDSVPPRPPSKYATPPPLFELYQLMPPKPLAEEEPKPKKDLSLLSCLMSPRTGPSTGKRAAGPPRGASPGRPGPRSSPGSRFCRSLSEDIKSPTESVSSAKKRPKAPQSPKAPQAPPQPVASPRTMEPLAAARNRAHGSTARSTTPSRRYSGVDKILVKASPKRQEPPARRNRPSSPPKKPLSIPTSVASASRTPSQRLRLNAPVPRPSRSPVRRSSGSNPRPTSGGRPSAATPLSHTASPARPSRGRAATDAPQATSPVARARGAGTDRSARFLEPPSAAWGRPSAS